MKSIFVLFTVFLLLLTDLVRGEQTPISRIANEFLVIAYPAPPPEQANIERYREITNAGFDAIVPGMGAWDSKSHNLVLDLAEKVGLRVIATDLRIMPWHEEDRQRIDQSLIDAVTADYRNHPALLGYYICDEPNVDYFEELASTLRRMHRADSKHPSLINLFPGYGSPKQLGFEDFREYVHRFIQTVKPQILSYDHYPFLASGLDDSGWYDDLKVIRDESRQANIPFWICLQSEGIEDYLRIPNRSEVFWQVGTVLAYGARGVTWFTYWTPPPSQGIPVNKAGEDYMAVQHLGGMISQEGKRTPLYDTVREANLFLRKAGGELLGWDNKFIAHYENGKLEEGSPSTCFSLVGTNSKLVVGTFVQGDRRRVVIANDSYTKSAAFSIEPKNNWQPSAVVASLEAHQESSGENFSRWRLGPGGCLVLECQQATSLDH